MAMLPAEWLRTRYQPLLQKEEKQSGICLVDNSEAGQAQGFGAPNLATKSYRYI